MSGGEALIASRVSRMVPLSTAQPHVAFVQMSRSFGGDAERSGSGQTTTPRQRGHSIYGQIRPPAAWAAQPQYLPVTVSADGGVSPKRAPTRSGRFPGAP